MEVCVGQQARAPLEGLGVAITCVCVHVCMHCVRACVCVHGSGDGCVVCINGSMCVWMYGTMGGCEDGSWMYGWQHPVRAQGGRQARSRTPRPRPSLPRVRSWRHTSLHGYTDGDWMGVSVVGGRYIACMYRCGELSVRLCEDDLY